MGIPGPGLRIGPFSVVHPILSHLKTHVQEHLTLSFFLVYLSKVGMLKVAFLSFTFHNVDSSFEMFQMQLEQFGMLALPNTVRKTKVLT